MRLLPERRTVHLCSIFADLAATTTTVICITVRSYRRTIDGARPAITIA